MASFDNMADGMRAGMRRLAKGVTVISTRDADGNRHAMTASAVTSLSDDPASLLICVNKSASLHPVLSAGANFCVNVLRHGQDDISNICAGKEKGEVRFSLGSWDDHGADQLPYITDADASFFCTNDGVQEYGTHIIVIGKLNYVMVSDDDVSPLVYVDGAYKTC